LAIALTADFDVIKIFWFFLQALLIGFISMSLAQFIGGKIGASAALLIPLLWISFPVLSNFQYGQFHMVSILLAVGAMMWFAQGKHKLGGVSLAFAILSKISPGILLIYFLQEISGSLGQKLIMIVTGIFMFLSLGVLPLPGLDNPSVFISLAALGMLVMISFNLWVLFRTRQMAEE